MTTQLSPLRSSPESLKSFSEPSSKPPACSHDHTDALIERSRFLGLLMMNRLEMARIALKLDNNTLCLLNRASTPLNRAHIVKSLLPFGCVAGSWLAAWVWVGGRFPSQIDIISTGHYRSSIIGRKIHVSNRALDPHDSMLLGNLRLTSPTRTLCDISCTQQSEKITNFALEVIPRLHNEYRISTKECLRKLQKNPRWPGYSEGILTINAL